MSSAQAKNVRLLKDPFDACRKGFFIIVFFSFFINILVLTAPLYMMQVFDRVLMSRSGETLLMLTAIAVAALIVMALLEMVRTSIMIRLGHWLDKRLGGAMLSASIEKSLQQDKDPNIQGLRDLATLRGFLTGPGIFPILDAPWTPLFIAVIFIINPLLGWISLLGALFLFFLALANELSTRTLLQQANGANIKAMTHAESCARNAATVNAMGMMPNIIERWTINNEEALDLQSRASARSSAITACSKFARTFLQVAIMGAGAWLVIQNEMLAGGMLAASILMGRALAPVEQAISTWKNVISSRGAFQRIKALQEQFIVGDEAMTLPRPKGKVVADKLTFRYPGAKEPVIRGVSFQLDPGEIMGLIGPSAAGKSTLAQLIVGNFEASMGSVRLDNADIAKWDSNDRGQHIGYLSQDVELFDGKIRENIARMGDGDTEPVIKAARLAGIDQMILELPEGYETEIGHGGSVLSGGQRQRVALARAIYGDPCLLVLDEPSSSLDANGEEALIGMIGGLKKQGVSIIIVAHRPRILQFVDKIMVLNGGIVQDIGPRDDIIAKLKGAAVNQDKSKTTPATAVSEHEDA